MKIRENICTTSNRQKANFHNTLKALKKKQTHYKTKQTPVEWTEDRQEVH